MKYKSRGGLVVPGCTPSPTTVLDNRSCRERTGCTRECVPKILKCDWCGVMDSRLRVLEEVETGRKINICSKCRDIIKDDIIYDKPPKIDAGNRFA
jgi:hypothetical protein